MLNGYLILYNEKKPVLPVPSFRTQKYFMKPLTTG